VIGSRGFVFQNDDDRTSRACKVRLLCLARVWLHVDVIRHLQSQSILDATDHDSVTRQSRDVLRPFKKNKTVLHGEQGRSGFFSELQFESYRMLGAQSREDGTPIGLRNCRPHPRGTPGNTNWVTNRRR
jgi:hypothetical protein